VESSTQSSDKAANQSPTDVMSLVKSLYRKREAMPMEAEPEEQDVNLDTE
jgi:hypothetical protein